MPAVVYILFGAGLTIAACFAAGRLLLARIKLPLDRGEHIVFSFLIGSSLLSTLVFLLCTSGLARKGVFLIAGVALLPALRKPLPPRSGARISVVWRMLLAAASTVYGVLYFVNALAPEISPDGATYHLGLVARYLREHGFHRITNDFHASFSQGVEMLYLFAFSIGRHPAAAMVHLAFLPILAAMVILYARRHAITEAGVCAAIFLFASPMFGIDAVSAYNDVATVAFIFGAFYLLQIWDEEQVPALAIPIGLLAGFTYAAKFTAAITIPYALVFVAWRSARRGQPIVKPALVIAAGALLVATPWIAKNWLWLGNPFSPFFNAWFPNPYIQVGFEKELGYAMRHYPGIESNWQLPWIVTMDGRLSGFLGPLFLLTPLGLLAMNRREGRQLALAAGIYGVPYMFNVGTRFLIPSMVFLALALAMVLVRWKLAAIVAIVHAILSWPALTMLYCNPGSWRLHGIPLRAALRLETEDHYLGTHLENYYLARLIERTVPPEGRVLSFRQVTDAYTTRDILVVYQSAENKMLGEILWTPLFDTYAPTRILEFQLKTERVRALRVIQTAAKDTEQWSITDLRVVPAAPIRSVAASPNRWELPFAFDGKPVTRWRTWLPLRPGQFVQVELAQPQPIEKVELQCTHDQPSLRLELQGQGPDGGWKTLSREPVEHDIPPIPGMRRMAERELRARGVTHILVFGTDLQADDFRTRAPEWGIEQVGEVGGDRLYKLNP